MPPQMAPAPTTGLLPQQAPTPMSDVSNQELAALMAKRKTDAAKMDIPSIAAAGGTGMAANALAQALQGYVKGGGTFGGGQPGAQNVVPQATPGAMNVMPQ